MSPAAASDNVHKEPGKPFVILSQGRSGTNFTISKILLSQQVLIGWEPFNTPMFGYGGFEHFSVPPNVIRKMNSAEFRDADPNGYIDYCAGFTGALNATGVRRTGFKIFPQHNADIYWQMTRDPRFNALVIERASKLSSYSSSLIAHTTGKWVDEGNENKDKGEGSANQVQVSFNRDQFVSYLNSYDDQIRRTVENLEAARVSYLKVYYEDLVGTQETLRDVFAFLGVEGEPAAETFIKKQNDSNVLKRFVNPEAARPFLERENEQAAHRQAGRATV